MNDQIGTGGPRGSDAAAASGKSAPSALMRYLFSQFGRPRGLIGWLAGSVMGQRSSNLLRNRWAVDLLELEPGMRVLEIGYGPGFALQQVCERLGEAGRAFGLDHSETMTRMAWRRNRAAIDAGKLRLFTGSAEGDALDKVAELAGPFDRIYAVNVNMFWSDPVSVLRTLSDRLGGGGRIHLTLQPRAGDRTEEGVLATAEKIACDMSAAGLKDVTTETFRDVTPMAICVLGRKSS